MRLGREDTDKGKTTTQVIIPRPFKLRLEYDAATGKKSITYLKPPHGEYISYGLHQLTDEEAQDMSFDVVGYWTGIIIGIQGKQCGEEIYYFVAYMPLQYPMKPPVLRFVTKICLPFVNKHGFVNVNDIPYYSWSPHHNLADVLMAIRTF